MVNDSGNTDVESVIIPLLFHSCCETGFPFGLIGLLTDGFISLGFGV